MKTIFILHLLLILFFPLSVIAQQFTFSGKVYHNETGEALKNVSIFEANSKIGTITDNRGFFKLVLSEGALNIEISDDGFKDFSENLVLKTDTIMVVRLEPEINSKNGLWNKNNLQADAKTSKKDHDNRLIRRSGR